MFQLLIALGGEAVSPKIKLKYFSKKLLALLTSLAITFAFLISVDIGSASLSENSLYFNEEGKFTVLQLADIQEKKNIAAGTIELIERSLARFSPDLVVLTGDNVKGNMSKSNFNTTAEEIVAPILADPKAKFAVTFGNHDDMGVPGWNGGGRQHQYDYFKSIGGDRFVDHNVAGLEGVGSSTIPIYLHGQTSGQPAYQIFLMDSGAYVSLTGTFFDLDGIRTKQIDYYLETYPTVPALWFQHIPIPEMYDLLVQVPEGTPNSFKGSHKPYKEYTWTLNTDLIDWRASGSTHIEKIYGESPGPIDLEDYTDSDHRSSPKYGSKTLYEAWLHQGNIQGVFFGHNHKNTFVGTTPDGIKMGHTKAATLEAYNDGDPGVRVFEIDSRGTYKTISITLSQLRAYENVSLVAVPGKGITVDSDRNLILGFPERLTTQQAVANYVYPVGNGALDYTTGQNLVTGTVISLLDAATGYVLREYRTVIFGDINIDGIVDSNDASVATDYENFLVSWDEDEFDYKFAASDINGDGIIDSNDASLITDYENNIK